jgi:hypothetical protein
MNIKRQYINTTTGKKSFKMAEIVTDDGFDMHWKPTRYKEMFTPFPHVSVVDYKQALSIPSIPEIDRSRASGLCPQKIVDILLTYAEQEISTADQHVVFHSSGWDSKIASSLFKMVSANRWVNVIFVCFKEEAEVFNKIMNWQGWDQDRVVVFDCEAPLPTFNQIHHQQNGPSDVIGARVYNALRFLEQKKKLIPNVKIWHQWSGNEVFKAEGTLHELAHKAYYSRLARQLPGSGYPYVDLFTCDDLLREVFTHRPMGEDFRIKMVRVMDDELCNPKYPKMSVNHTPVDLEMSDQRLQDINNDFIKSYYCQYLLPPALRQRPLKRISEHDSPYWSQVTTASTVQYLKESKNRFK